MMTIEDAKAIVRYGVTDIPITDGIIYDAMNTQRDPLVMAIMGRFPMINPHTVLDKTEFCIDGDSIYRHSQDLQAWLELTCELRSIYRRSVLARIDGPKNLITLATPVLAIKESGTECFLELPVWHPEVEKDKPQYPVGKLIEVCDVWHVLRFHKDQDAHSYVGRFSTRADAILRIEYSDDSLNIRPTIDIFDFLIQGGDNR